MKKIVVVTAPSGAGKTTIVKHLLATLENLEFSVSATNRRKRENEIDGRDYYFFTTDEFMNKIGDECFVEWEEVYPGKFYGTLLSEVDRIWRDGKVAVFDIDVAGARRVMEIYGEKALTIFIMPPSVELLTERLANRKTENPADRKERIDKAEFEMRSSGDFDFIVINDDLETAKKEAVDIVSRYVSMRNA